jgi:hypothetical protein
MQNFNLKRLLVIGTVLLFFGAGIVSAVNPNVMSTNVIEYIEIPSPDIETIYPSDDTFVTEAVGHSGNNYGDRNEVHVSNKYGSTPNWERNIFIKFDLSTLPSRIDIISAKLYLYYYLWMDTNPVGRPLNVHRVLSNWDESIITYDTQPPATPEICSVAYVPSSINFWMSWDLTNEVRDFVKGNENNYGWKIMDETYWGWFDLPVPYFYSKEYVDNNFHPYLEIEFTRSRSREITNPLLLQLFEHFPNAFPILRHLLGIL